MNCLQVERMESQNQLPQPIQQPGKGTTFLRTCFNGLNSLSGVGILSVPYALSQGGWLSLIFLFLIACVCWYTALLLQRCMEAHPCMKNYPDIGYYAFGCKGKAIISILTYLELYLLAVEFLILEGDNLEVMFPNTDVKVGSLRIGGKICFVLVAALIVLPTTWLRNLGTLAYVSASGVLAGVVLVGCVFWLGVVQGVEVHRGDILWNWRGMPNAISLFAFCYCTHAVFPTLHHSIEDKSQFSKVLVVCFGTATISNGAMAILGYMMYGQYVNSEVTLNLPIGKIASKMAIYITLISPLTKYALVMTPVANAVEETFLHSNSRTISIIMRTGLVIGTVFVALTLPFFGYMMAFIGAFMSITVSIVLPCLCYLKINKKSRKLGIELIMLVGIVVTGSIAVVLGTYTSVKDIVNHL